MDELAQKIYQTIRAFPNGVKNENLSDVCGVGALEIKEPLNQLLARHQIIIQTVANTNEILFVAVDEREAELLSDMDESERMVYAHIKAADNRGIWLKDLQRNTNLHRAVLTKVLKTLEQRNVIKLVKSVNTPSKKMYMLYDLIPSVDLTGGAWFTDNELDTEMINALSKVAIKYISDTCQTRTPNSILPASFKYPSAPDVLAFVNSKNVLMQELSLSDVTDLLDMLVNARQLERINLDCYRLDPRISASERPDNDSSLYKMSWWTEMPCGRCPVFDKCSSVGYVTPATCEYYDQWLLF